MISVKFSPDEGFSEEKAFIEGLIKEHAAKAVVVLSFENDITFKVSFEGVDEIRAFTQSSELITIAINPEHLAGSGGKREKTAEQLIYIIYHELHHAYRGYVGDLPAGQEHILINSMLSEGLADYFVRELYPSKHVLEKTGFDPAEIKDWFKKVGVVMWNREGDDDSWLYGGGDKPKMLGYKIGRYIVEKIKENNPSLDLIKIARLGPEELMKLSGVNLV